MASDSPVHESTPFKGNQCVSNVDEAVFHPSSSLPATVSKELSTLLSNAPHNHDPLGETYDLLSNILPELLTKHYKIQIAAPTNILSSIIVSYLSYTESTLETDAASASTNILDNNINISPCDMNVFGKQYRRISAASRDKNGKNEGAHVLFIQMPKSSLYPTKCFTLSQIQFQTSIDDPFDNSVDKIYTGIEKFDINNVFEPYSKKNAKSLLYKNVINVDKNGLVKYYPNCVLQCSQLYVIWFTITDDDKQNNGVVFAPMHTIIDYPNLKLLNRKNNSRINRWSLKGKNCWYLNDDNMSSTKNGYFLQVAKDSAFLCFFEFCPFFSTS